MPHFVYVLFSKKDKGIYIGCANNLRRRLREHFKGKVYSTCKRRPLTLLYCEVYPEQEDAYRREKFLKTGWGRNYLRKVLKTFWAKRWVGKTNKSRK